MRLRKLGTLLLLALSPCFASRAAALDKSAKAWLGEVGPIILPEEEKVYRTLEDRSDLREFQKIFWARRNPDGAAAAENPYKAEYEKLKPEIDERFRIRSRQGTETDCGRAVMLLGEPAAVRTLDHGVIPAVIPDWRDPTPTRTVQLGSTVGRRFETWVFEGSLFRNGRIWVTFDESCSAPFDFRFELAKVARSLVAHPGIRYEQDRGGHLISLDDQLRKLRSR